MVKIYTVGKVMVALTYAPGSFEKYLFYFIQIKSVEYLLEPVYILGVLMHTTASDRQWGGDEILK